MQTRQGNTVRSLRAVEDFLDDNSATFPDIATSGARKTLGGAIATLSAHATDQSGSTISAQSGTKKTRALRAVLRGNYMAPISRIARAELPNTQELLPLRAPRGNPTTEKLAVASRGMAQAAAPYADQMRGFSPLRSRNASTRKKTERLRYPSAAPPRVRPLGIEPRTY